MSNEVVAQQLSEALWELGVPKSKRGKWETKSLFGVRKMKDGSKWLCVNTEVKVKVDVDAELGGVESVLRPWEVSGKLQSGTIDGLKALVEVMRGEWLTVWLAFPMLFREMSKTKEELVTLNLWEDRA